MAAAKRATMPLASCLSDQRSVVSPTLLIRSVSLPALRVYQSFVFSWEVRVTPARDKQRFTGGTLPIASLCDPGSQKLSSYRFHKLVLEKGTTMENLLTTTSLVVIISRHVGLIMKPSSTQRCWLQDTRTLAAKPVSRPPQA